MKKKLFLVCIITALLLSACYDDESPSTNWGTTTTYLIVPYKGAGISVKYTKHKDSYYAQYVELSMDDTTEARNKIVLSINENIILTTTDNKWSCKIDSAHITRTGYDSLKIHIEHSGHSSRYDWYYNRQKDGYLLLNQHEVKSVSANIIPYAFYCKYQIPNDTLKYSYYDPNALFYEVTNIQYGTDHTVFSPMGGNQLEIVIEYPEENNYFDNISIWYGEKLLDDIPHGTWRKRYYLDDFPSGESLYLKSTRNGQENTYDIINIDD